MSGWIGVDLDGTLAEYHGWKGVEHIGEPIPDMVNRVRAWLAAGETVKVFTARVGKQDDGRDLLKAERAIKTWCERHIGRPLEVTASKDFGMKVLYDDRAIQVEHNTGRLIQ